METLAKLRLSRCGSDAWPLLLRLPIQLKKKGSNDAKKEVHDDRRVDQVGHSGKTNRRRIHQGIAMAKFDDITNRKFGTLTAMWPAGIQGTSRSAHYVWLTACECGKYHLASRSNLTSGGIASCGCRTRELLARRGFRHGHGGTNRHGGRSVEYRAWAAMLTRCKSQSPKCWPYYGARGITVCDRWKDFRNFLADMGPKPRGLTLDRINNNGNYEPGNCRWATYEEQAANKSGPNRTGAGRVPSL